MTVKRYELYPEQQVKCDLCSCYGKYGVAITVIIRQASEDTKETVALCTDHDEMFGSYFETEALA